MPKLTASVILRFLLLGAIVALPRAADAQNLLVNPHFDTGISSWSGTGLSFDATSDAGGSPTSGSAQDTITLPNIGVPISQCVAATAGTSYDFGGSIRATVLSNGGGAGITVGFFQGGACSGISTSGPVTPLVTTTGTYTTVSATAVAPPLTLSAEIVGGFSTTGNFQANFDDMFFQPSTTVPVMPWWILSVLTALGLAAGSYALARPTRLACAAAARSVRRAPTRR